MPTQYSNPCVTKVIDTWPFGSHKTKAIFGVERKHGKGQRIIRVLIDPKTGKECTPKKLTYAVRACIVDGDDGRTYLLNQTIYKSISVMKGDMQVQHEHITNEDPRYPTLLAMLAMLEEVK